MKCWEYISAVFVFVVVIYGNSNRELREIKFENGQLKVKYYVKLDALKNEIKDGLYTIWYENGQKKEECLYKDGKKNGPCTGWHENGKKQFEATYKDGKITYWHKNGQKASECIYKDGKQSGPYTAWDENGRDKSYDTTFTNGYLIDVIQ